ncbi:phage portal protein [Pseudarthrobacter sp. S9]|uniref:phage portal protein n=1 Tax=Pseudarthrobacter sp. S9 TaxID=3418421 RepID=UPI003CFE9BFA
MDLFRDGLIKRAAGTPQSISDALVVQGMTNGGSMGPGTPVSPSRGYSVRPRATDYPMGVNISTRSRQAWGRTSYDVLRELMRSYDIAQMCKNHKIDELRSMEPLFTPMDGFKGDGEAAVAAARAALSFPDREHSWDEWLSLWIDNLLTFDSGPLYRRRNRDGKIIGLEIVDGSTIYPLIDDHGRRPQAPAPAYQQVIKGQASVDFTAEDITYARFRPQTDSPFGMAPLEAIMMTVNTDMRFQWHLLQMFTEGSIPGGFMEVPPDVNSADQVAEWQDYWDATFMGDQSIVHKLVAVPAGAKFTGTAPAAFDPEFPKYLAIKVAGAFGVVPQDLGLTDDVNRATGETQTDTQFRVNTLPWVRFVETIVTRYLQHDLGLPVQVKLNTGRDKEDRLTEAQAHKVYIEMGMESPDEARESILGLPVDNERPVPRGLILPRQGFVPLVSLLAISGKVDTETKAPADDQPIPEVPFAGTPGLLPDKLPGSPEFKRAPINPDEPQFPELEHEHPETAIVTKPVTKELTAGVTSATGITGIDRVEDEIEKAEATVAGAAIKASDTGRVLMIQRYLDPEDPAGGTWEFPGGHLDAGETAQAAAIREWEEETGLDFPAGATLSGTWASPDGNYAGHVFKVATEASIAINTGDGEDGETLAWFHPDHLDGFPALREELAANLPEDELAKATARELSKFRTFTKARAKTGKWRDFEFTAIPAPVAKHLNDHARESFTKDDPGSDARPKAGTPSWRDDPPVMAPQHAVDLALTDYWAPQIRDSLLDMWKAQDLNSAVTATDGVGDMGIGVFRQVARQVLSGAVQPSTLEQVIYNAWADAYNVGIMAAKVQMGSIPPGWDTWKPGMTDANKITALGWKEALQDADITLKGITDTTMNKLAYRIADGVNAGSPSDLIGGELDDILGDPLRAELIAHTETARMLTNAAMDQYRLFGVKQWDLVTSAGACPICLSLEDQNPHEVGDGKQPPVHPRCRCAASPHLDGTAANV